MTLQYLCLTSILKSSTRTGLASDITGVCVVTVSNLLPELKQSDLNLTLQHKM